MCKIDCNCKDIVQKMVQNEERDIVQERKRQIRENCRRMQKHSGDFCYIMETENLHGSKNPTTGAEKYVKEEY